MAAVTGTVTGGTQSRSYSGLRFGISQGNASNSPITLTGISEGDELQAVWGIGTDNSTSQSWLATATVTDNTVTIANTTTSTTLLFIWIDTSI